MRELSYTIYSTQAEGGIQGDGDVGIQWPAGNLSVSNLNAVVDELQNIIKAMIGEGNKDIPRSNKIAI